MIWRGPAHHRCCPAASAVTPKAFWPGRPRSSHPAKTALASSHRDRSPYWVMQVVRSVRWPAAAHEPSERSAWNVSSEDVPAIGSVRTRWVTPGWRAASSKCGPDRRS